MLADLDGVEKALVADRDGWLVGQQWRRRRPVDIRARWFDGRMGLAWKRAGIEDALVAVIAQPANRPGPRWDPDRLEPLWRELDAGGR